MKSLIDIHNYQDAIILKLYHDKDFIIYIVNFYKFLNNINFAESYHRDSVNYKNKEIKENYDNLLKILEADDDLLIAMQASLKEKEFFKKYL